MTLPAVGAAGKRCRKNALPPPILTPVENEFGIDLNRARAFQKEKDRRRRARVEVRFEQATRDARAIVAAIAEQVNPRRIYQWGSLLDPSRFSEISDIDIAVEGLRGPAEFFRALGIAMDGSALPVDVIELEKAPKEIAERIRARGVLVHERSDP